MIVDSVGGLSASGDMIVQGGSRLGSCTRLPRGFARVV